MAKQTTWKAWDRHALCKDESDAWRSRAASAEDELKKIRRKAEIDALTDVKILNGKTISGTHLLGLCHEAEIPFGDCIYVEATANTVTFYVLERDINGVVIKTRGVPATKKVRCLINWRREPLPHTVG